LKRAALPQTTQKRRVRSDGSEGDSISGSTNRKKAQKRQAPKKSHSDAVPLQDLRVAPGLSPLRGASSVGGRACQEASASASASASAAASAASAASCSS